MEDLMLENIKMENLMVKEYLKFCLKFIKIYIKWPDGRIYEGEYLNDRKNGKGILTYPNGNKYEGFFLNGQMNGEGYLTINNIRKKGLWNSGNRIKWIE